MESKKDIINNYIADLKGIAWKLDKDTEQVRKAEAELHDTQSALRGKLSETTDIKSINDILEFHFQMHPSTGDDAKGRAVSAIKDLLYLRENCHDDE